MHVERTGRCMDNSTQLRTAAPASVAGAAASASAPLVAPLAWAMAARGLALSPPGGAVPRCGRPRGMALLLPPGAPLPPRPPAGPGRAVAGTAAPRRGRLHVRRPSPAELLQLKTICTGSWLMQSRLVAERERERGDKLGEGWMDKENMKR